MRRNEAARADDGRSFWVIATDQQRKRVARQPRTPLTKGAHAANVRGQSCAPTAAHMRRSAPHESGVVRHCHHLVL